MMIEFLEETHTYLVEGILTPSVTELIHNIYMPNQYSGISKAVLANAADYGNRVHSLVEHWNSTGTTPDWLEKVIRNDCHELIYLLCRKLRHNLRQSGGTGCVHVQRRTIVGRQI